MKHPSNNFTVKKSITNKERKSNGNSIPNQDVFKQQNLEDKLEQVEGQLREAYNQDIYN